MQSTQFQAEQEQFEASIRRYSFKTKLRTFLKARKASTLSFLRKRVSFQFRRLHPDGLGILVGFEAYRYARMAIKLQG